MPQLTRGFLSGVWKAWCAAGLLIAAAPAGAALITTTPQEVDFYLSCFCNPEVDTDGNPVATQSTNRNFTQFDPNLGVLKEVRFTWITGVGATVYSDDVVDPTQTGNELTVDFKMELLGAGAPDPVLMTAQRKLVGTLQQNGSLGASISDDPENGDRTFAVPTDLSYFIGNGSFTTRIGYRAEVTSDNATMLGFAAWYQDTDHPGRLQVEYTYEARTTSVPEAGTLMLAALGTALGAGFIRRRRSRAA